MRFKKAFFIMNYFFINPVGGLANRMRVLESAYNFSASNNLKLIVLWERNDMLNANYSDCFEHIPGATLIQLNYNGKSVFAKAKRNFLTLATSIVAQLTISRKFEDHDVERILIRYQHEMKDCKRYFDTVATLGDGMYMKTCWDFYPNSKDFKLEIKSNIKNLGNQILKPRRCNIGVHIRRSDNAASILNSPLELFIAEITNALRSSPNLNFYLSTDSDDVAVALKQKFDSKIVTGVNVRERNSRKGICAALIDLYCLSTCEEVWGSHSSSFSQRAATISNIPLKVISQPV